ncbi:MAG: CopG family transcriptional regulator [Actinomycetota bacterium]
MIRKQVYLERDQDRKLKALAARRRCTEAEIIRQALDRLPDPETDDPVAILEAAGLLVPKLEPGPDDVSDEELEVWHERWQATRTEPIGLSVAIRKDRDKR